MEHNELMENRGVTLNDLQEEQRSLNMRMLLAIQLRDAEAQAELQAALDDVAAKIERMLADYFKH